MEPVWAAGAVEPVRERAEADKGVLDVDVDVDRVIGSEDGSGR